MLARLRSWWKNTSKTLDAVVILMLVVLIALVVVSILGYIHNWDWVGLGQYVSKPHPQNTEFQREKTLWDWLQLLIIPAVLAMGGYLFTYTTSQNEQMATQLRDRTERDISLDNQREQALQAYIDSMSDLLLEKDLRKSGEDAEVRKIARVRTLTVLPRLDGKRKASVLQFLYESGLIKKDKRIIDLSGADLSGSTLSGKDLSRADLRKANLTSANLYIAHLAESDLSEADLSEANLVFADLRGANLSRADFSSTALSFFLQRKLPGANLPGTNLRGANLYKADVTDEQLNKAISLEGATMPDGSIHA